MKKLIFVMSGILIMMGVVFTADGIAQDAPPDIKVTLALDKSIYGPEDPVYLVMTLANEGNVDVITSKGFSDREFYLLLRFFDEEGNVITSFKLDDATAITPPAPKVFPDEAGLLLQGELVEFLAAKNSDGTGGWVKSFGSFTVSEEYLDAYDYYPLAGKSGHFTVKAVIPMRSYMDYALTSSGVQYAPLDTANWYGTLESNILSFALVVDADGDGYFYPEPYGSNPEADCDDTNIAINPDASEIPGNGINDDCNPETLDEAVVINPGIIIIKTTKRTTGPGSDKETRRMPIQDMPIRVYDTSAESCAAGIGVSKKHYKSIWYACTPPNGADVTDSSGTATIEVAAGDYIVLGEYDPDGVPDNGDEIYPAASIKGLEAGVTVQDELLVMVKAAK